MSKNTVGSREYLRENIGRVAAKAPEPIRITLTRTHWKESSDALYLMGEVGEPVDAVAFEKDGRDHVLVIDTGVAGWREQADALTDRLSDKCHDDYYGDRRGRGSAQYQASLESLIERIEEAVKPSND